MLFPVRYCSPLLLSAVNYLGCCFIWLECGYKALAGWLQPTPATPNKYNDHLICQSTKGDDEALQEYMNCATRHNKRKRGSLFRHYFYQCSCLHQKHFSLLWPVSFSKSCKFPAKGWRHCWMLLLEGALISLLYTGTQLSHITFLRKLGFWAKLREKYPHSDHYMGP